MVVIQILSPYINPNSLINQIAKDQLFSFVYEFTVHSMI